MRIFEAEAAEFDLGVAIRFGIEIGAGLGEFKGRVWRIGLMGYGARATNVLTFLAALEQLTRASTIFR